MNTWNRRQVIAAGAGLELLPTVGRGTADSGIQTAVYPDQLIFGERDAENRLLPMAADMGVAVIINRPYRAGRLFRAVRGRELPEFAQTFADSWGQFFLKFIISHPAVTCVIPATSKPHHMLDNLGAGFGTMPDTAMRKRMADYFTSL